MSYIHILDSSDVSVDGALFYERFNTGGGRVMVEIDGSTYIRVENFIFSRARSDVITVIDSDHVTINDGTIRHPCRVDDDTYDAVRITTSDYCRVTQLTIIPETGENLPRYGINIASGDCNIVVGNDLGSSADYGTAPINDAGTNTSLEWPNDPTYGDNFVDCATSPSSP